MKFQSAWDTLSMEFNRSVGWVLFIEQARVQSEESPSESLLNSVAIYQNRKMSPHTKESQTCIWHSIAMHCWNRISGRPEDELG